MALLYPAGYQFFDSNGDPLAAGTVRFYITETTTDKAIYSDQELTASASNPYTLDSSGRLAVNIYGSGVYTVLVKDSAAATVFTRDDVFGWGDYVYQHSDAGSVERTMAAKFEEFIDGADFGMVAGGTSNTTFFNAAVAAAIANNKTLRIGPGTYYFDTQPASISGSLQLKGSGQLNTVLYRNYNGTSNVGLLRFVTGSSGFKVSDLCVSSPSGKTGGCAISAVCDSNDGISSTTLENLYLTGAGTDNWAQVIRYDGTLKTTGAIGNRVSQFNNVNVFGASDTSVYLSGCVGVSWIGGGVYSAGGTGTTSLTITGTAGVNSYYCNMMPNNLNAATSLSYCQFVTINSSVIGDIINTATAQYCRVSGYLGTTQNNWLRSGAYWPDKLYGSTTFDCGNLTTLTRSEATVTVTGAVLTDIATASFSLDTQGIMLSARVSAANTVTVVFFNPTTGAIDLGSGTLRAEVTKAQA